MNAIKGSFSIDPYEVLGLSKDCTDAEVVKAYRKAALKWHPDKNPDKKQLAEEMFLKISQALELLSDPAAKGAYDRLQATKTARAVYVQKRQQTDSAKRARFREELEKREAGAFSAQEEAKSAEKNLEKEIERLRKQGSTLLQRERENIEMEVRRQANLFTKAQTSSQASESSARLKVRWRTKHGGESYDEEQLRKMFEKYGKVAAVVISASGKGSAIIEFENAKDALKAENEKGTVEIPVKVSWVSERPQSDSESRSEPDAGAGTSSATDSLPRFRTAAQFADFEAEVLAKMMGTAPPSSSKPGVATSKFDDL